jgi:hypothetical protein
MAEQLTHPGYRHFTYYTNSRRLCPVCNVAVYSAAGIHPQCASKRSEDREWSARRADNGEAKDGDVKRRPFDSVRFNRSRMPK